MLWYTGQGANDLQGDHRQTDSQLLVRGNLAFAKTIDRRQRWLEGGEGPVEPVRVIRGYERKTKKAVGVAAAATPTAQDGTAKVFLYSGLFDVVEMRTEYNKVRKTPS